MARFDVIYDSSEAKVDFHFCREVTDIGECFGTDATHGLSFEAAKEEVARYYDEQAKFWRALTEKEWTAPLQADFLKDASQNF